MLLERQKERRGKIAIATYLKNKGKKYRIPVFDGEHCR
jgi:hypothetical protein